MTVYWHSLAIDLVNIGNECFLFVGMLAHWHAMNFSLFGRLADRMGNVGKLVQFTCIAYGNHIWKRGQTLWSTTVTFPACKVTDIVKPCNMHVMEY